MRVLPLVTAVAMLAGCIGPVNIAWRGVIHHTENRATTEGRIDNRPTGNSGSVEAAKTNDIRTDLQGGKTQ
ncbi:MAG: hypothetical protein ACI4WT_03120 [Oligosphaeraceae bacterium]